ncbi:uncharacterized protein TNCV_2168151 [Trichonephila clavipes]|nr:uncharacterized protein TNCV_2168151 [Trichonephila clavipes]
MLLEIAIIDSYCHWVTKRGNYTRQAPGGALSIKADRVVQTTISRLASGHIRGLSFNLGQKIYENCTKCNLVQATPDHLLFCAGLEREDIYSSPLLVDEAHFWLNGYVNKQNCRIWSEANPQVYVETPLHPEKLTVWCALWAGGIILQKR